jgi:tRNA dimethylallyltransferase
VTVLLTLPRGELDRRIEARVHAMLEAGLVDEVRALLAAGYTPEDPGMTGTGYREVLRHLSGEWSLERTRVEIRSATRKYAGRQLTWFRNQLPPGTLTVDAELPLDQQVAAVVEAWRTAMAEERTG